MSLIITYGNVFNYNEKDYVFLAKTKDIIYAAEIFDKEKSILYKKVFNRIAKNSQQTYKLRQHHLYCFVELRTEEFKERVAYYGRPAQGDVPNFFENPICTLNNYDLAELHKELLADDIAVPQELKNLIKNIKIK